MANQPLVANDFQIVTQSKPPHNKPTINHETELPWSSFVPTLYHQRGMLFALKVEPAKIAEERLSFPVISA